ncbi:hypothetical protein CCR75_005311 [Bremia lactucae]|uniref:Uncharacterized protein n=1 Tax=Bremia lactucae TaxID=4779 RepID=A0A976FJG0_BRELC|nr:hypothetical protein CCR75_005311 [Bremia lactucae]
MAMAKSPARRRSLLSTLMVMTAEFKMILLIRKADESAGAEHLNKAIGATDARGAKSDEDVATSVL